MKRPDQPFETREAAIEAFARHVSAGKAELYRGFGLDAVMGAREGAWFHDAYGERRWLNCHCNGGVFNLGHRHPRILRALVAALESLDVGNHHLMSGFRAELARRLSRTTGDRLSGVVFGVGGGEAMDLAIKVARGTTGRPGVVSAIGGYHGHTGLAMAAGDAQYRDPFGPNPPGFAQVPFDDVPALDRAVRDDTAAVVLEPVPATLGMPVPDPGYLPEAARLCRDRGALLVVDEVQTGLGRTGRLWCYQHDGVQPDLLVTGKGLGGGLYPIAATLMTPEVHRLLDDHPFAHISTFGGSEIGCAVALEVLDVVESPGFLDRVVEVSDRLAEAFAGAPFTLRRKGLMMGLRLAVERGGMLAAKVLYDAGVFAVWANNDPSVLQLLPPLTITDGEVDYLVERVRGSLC